MAGSLEALMDLLNEPLPIPKSTLKAWRRWRGADYKRGIIWRKKAGK